MKSPDKVLPLKSLITCCYAQLTTDIILENYQIVSQHRGGHLETEATNCSSTQICKQICSVTTSVQRCAMLWGPLLTLSTKKYFYYNKNQWYEQHVFFHLSFSNICNSSFVIFCHWIDPLASVCLFNREKKINACVFTKHLLNLGIQLNKWTKFVWRFLTEFNFEHMWEFAPMKISKPPSQC